MQPSPSMIRRKPHNPNICGKYWENRNPFSLKSGAKAAFSDAMSSDDSIQNNVPATLEPEGTVSWREPNSNFDPTRHMAPAVAHELNNILTVVQGYADRLLLHHGGDPALMPHLKQISEAARRAAGVIRKATPPKPKDVYRENSQPGQAA